MCRSYFRSQQFSPPLNHRMLTTVMRRLRCLFLWREVLLQLMLTHVNHPFHCHVTAEIKPRHRHKPQGGGRGFKRFGNKRSQGPRGKSRFARKQQAEGKVGS